MILGGKILHFLFTREYRAWLLLARGRSRYIAQSSQPVGGLFGPAAAYERAESFVQPTRSKPMVVPDSQDGKHISGEAAMDSNERAQDTVPVLDSTAGSNRLIPGSKQLGHHRLPNGGKISGQFLGLWP